MAKDGHDLSEINTETRTGECARCGPVRVYHSGNTSWVCANRVNAERRKKPSQAAHPHVHRLSEIDVDERMATCANCGRVKIYSSGKNGWRCSVAKLANDQSDRRANYDIAYRAKPENRAKAKVAARNHWVRRYGITPEQYEEMLSSQDHKCAICQEPCPTGHRLAIDHDASCCSEPMRSCGKCIRGLLCMICNRSLGGFRHDPAILRRAATYAERTTAPPAEADGAAETTR